jgi:hypothetical protein
MRYLYPERMFWAIAKTMTRPELSILPYIHKKYVSDIRILKGV